MAKKLWTFSLDGAPHTVELEHAYLSGHKTIRVDGEPLPLLAAAQSPVDFGGDYPFVIGRHECVVHIHTNGLTFRYDFSIDGRSLDTGGAPARANAAQQLRFAQNSMCCWAIGGGLLFILFGEGWNLHGLIPLPYLGWTLVVIGVLGLAGVNIFKGGPLDKQNAPGNDEPSTL